MARPDEPALEAIVWVLLIQNLRGAREIVGRMPPALRVELSAACFALTDAIREVEQRERPH